MGAQPISIRIDKRIPPGTGVGAGSANAAQILLFAVKQDWITIDQARDMAPALGSDVSFFLDQKPALVEGTGERNSPCRVRPSLWSSLLSWPICFQLRKRTVD